MAKSDVEKMFGSAVLQHPELLKVVQDDRGSFEGYMDFEEDRRPMAYSDILAIFEYQRQADPRQRVIKALKFVSKIATASSGFVSGIDYARGVSMFTGVFTPESVF